MQQPLGHPAGSRHQYPHYWQIIEKHSNVSNKRVKSSVISIRIAMIKYKTILNSTSSATKLKFQMHDDVIKWKLFFASLALCAGNPPVTGEFPTQRPVTRSFDVFFDLHLNERLSKQPWGWWYETLSRPLWHHSNKYLSRHQCLNALNNINTAARERLRLIFQTHFLGENVLPFIHWRLLLGVQFTMIWLRSYVHYSYTLTNTYN